MTMPLNNNAIAPLVMAILMLGVVSIWPALNLYLLVFKREGKSEEKREKEQENAKQGGVFSAALLVLFLGIGYFFPFGPLRPTAEQVIAEPQNWGVYLRCGDVPRSVVAKAAIVAYDKFAKAQTVREKQNFLELARSLKDEVIPPPITEADVQAMNSLGTVAGAAKVESPVVQPHKESDQIAQLHIVAEEQR